MSRLFDMLAAAFPAWPRLIAMALGGLVLAYTVLALLRAPWSDARLAAATAVRGVRRPTQHRLRSAAWTCGTLAAGAVAALLVVWTTAWTIQLVRLIGTRL